MGWTDDRNVRIDIRWSAGNADDVRKQATHCHQEPSGSTKNHYQRLRNQAQVLEAQANQTRFRKQIDIRHLCLPRYPTSFVTKSRALRTYLRRRQLNW